MQVYSHFYELVLYSFFFTAYIFVSNATQEIRKTNR